MYEMRLIRHRQGASESRHCDPCLGGRLVTLTDIIPSLRRSLPDPLNVDRWPAFTRATVADIVVAGVSMSRLVELCETPCVHTADAVIPGAGGRPSLVDAASIVNTSVIAVSTSSDLPRTVVIDACFDSVPAFWGEARLIARTSTTHRRPTRVLSRTTMIAVIVSLPEDISAGDLLVVPCAGWVTRRDVISRQSSLPPESASMSEKPTKMHA